MVQSSVQTPRVKSNVNEALLKSALKRVRESPDEDMAVLKNICLDPLQIQYENNAVDSTAPMDRR